MITAGGLNRLAWRVAGAERDAGPVSALEFFDDPAAFLDTAGEYLAAEPVVGSVVATVTRRIQDSGSAGEPTDPDIPRWWVVVRSDHGTDRAGQVVGLGMRTAPFEPNPLFLMPMPPGAGAAIAQAMHARGEVAGGGTYGVNGALAAAAECAEEVARLTGGRVSTAVRTRLFELTDRAALRGPRATVPGSLCRAAEADADLVLQWFVDFGAAADAQAGRTHGAHTEPATFQDVLQRIGTGGVWLWQDADGVPVHVTAASGPQFGVCRVGPVYTPAEHRGHGYATAAVAAVTEGLLGRGARVCLFTDQANPTSNAVYQRIGYTPVVDMANLLVRPGSEHAERPDVVPFAAGQRPQHGEVAVPVPGHRHQHLDRLGEHRAGGPSAEVVEVDGELDQPGAQVVVEQHRPAAEDGHLAIGRLGVQPGEEPGQRGPGGLDQRVEPGRRALPAALADACVERGVQVVQAAQVPEIRCGRDGLGQGRVRSDEQVVDQEQRAGQVCGQLPDAHPWQRAGFVPPLVDLGCRDLGGSGGGGVQVAGADRHDR